MSIQLLRTNRIELGILPNTLMVGISYDKPHVFVALGFIYLEINLLSKKKRRKQLHEKSNKHPRSSSNPHYF